LKFGAIKIFGGAVFLSFESISEH